MERDPRPDQPRGGSAVGLVFVGVVLCTLFTAAALGVLAAHRQAPAAPPLAAADRAGELARAAPAELAARDRVYAGLEELVRRREAALRDRDPSILEAVWTPGSPWLSRDLAEVGRLRASGRRWADLRLTVEIIGAARPDDGRWTVLARLGRDQARLVEAGSGAVIRTVPAATASYRCQLVESGGRWRLVAFQPS
jgi:hypothetical protein